MQTWVKIRGPLLAVLLCAGAAVYSWRAGFSAGRESQVGHPGHFETASVEWQDEAHQRAVVWITDGSHGYVFGVQPLAHFHDYSEATRIFTFDNTDQDAQRLALDAARGWCRREWNWTEMRAAAGKMLTVNDYEEPGSGVTMIELRRKAADQEYRDLRAAYQELAHELERARLKLSTQEPPPPAKQDAPPK
ncbi:MAG TPA: hypothetical protein VG457_11665 [Planctomycetota bacterium]|nr:hypothetical protein [Planctomycetota bacterium]